MASKEVKAQALKDIREESFMLSDEALNARYSDAETLESLFACEHTGQMMRDMWAKIQVNTPDQERPFLTAMKKGLYRKTSEYTNASCNAYMKIKDAPKARPMAGYGSNSYRTWSR